MPVTATLFASVVPMITYLLIIWKMDKYEPEPLRFVFFHFLWGAIGAVVLAIVGGTLLSNFAQTHIEESSLRYMQVVAFAPFVEELTKGLFLLLITLRSRKFDNLTDGLVYGGAIGLGFGMTENFMYFLSYSNDVSVWVMVVILRSCFSAVMHCISTAILGAFLGLSKLAPFGKKIFFIFSGIFIAMFIHFFWNFSVINENTFLFGIFYILVLISLFFVLFSYSLSKERAFIFEELHEEYLNQILPLEHLQILSSAGRNRKGWVDESIRKAYIKAATKLAFRKMELKHSSKNKKQYIVEDIEKQRDIIRSLLFQN